jgi:hypothetical protein
VSVGARVKYLSIAELVDIFFHAHNRVEVVLWLRAIVCSCFELIILRRLSLDPIVMCRIRVVLTVLHRSRVESIILHRLRVESIVLHCLRVELFVLGRRLA